MWDNCIPSKLDAEQSSGEFDESDEMQFEIYNQLHAFYGRNEALPYRQENEIMDLFRYFVVETCCWKPPELLVWKPTMITHWWKVKTKISKQSP